MPIKRSERARSCVIIHLTAPRRRHASSVTLEIALCHSTQATLLFLKRKKCKKEKMSPSQPAVFYLLGKFVPVPYIQRCVPSDELITPWTDSSRLPSPGREDDSLGLKNERPERWQLEGRELDGPSRPINGVWGRIKANGKICRVSVAGQADFGERVGVTDDKCWQKAKTKWITLFSGSYSWSKKEFWVHLWWIAHASPNFLWHSEMFSDRWTYGSSVVGSPRHQLIFLWQEN